MTARRRTSRWLPVLLATLALHLLLGVAGHYALPYFGYGIEFGQPDYVELEWVDRDDAEDEVADAEPDLDDKGQIVETAKPKIPERPEDADYLAEHDTVVDEEMRSELFDINPEVVAPQFSEQSKMEHEDLVDMNVDKPSTGATPGNLRFDPARDGAFAQYTSPWLYTNRAGLQDPVPASHTTSFLSGAPQNDLLDETVGPMTQLNTKEVLYASYLLRIRRLVNFYWEQNLRNLPKSVRIAKPEYTTGVMVVLDGNGALEGITVSGASGVDALDDAVVRAYKLAGPFPNPPDQLIESDGRVYLPLMTWTVRFGAAANRFDAIDPNAGQRFPGLHKSPR